VRIIRKTRHGHAGSHYGNGWGLSFPDILYGAPSVVSFHFIFGAALSLHAGWMSMRQLVCVRLRIFLLDRIPVLARDSDRVSGARRAKLVETGTARMEEVRAC
jgi:hypothetical protein